MYEAFFHFHDRPFAAVPEARRYFPAATIEEARQTLLRLIERADGPGLVIGPAGTGKSLLCHVLAAHCRASYDVVLLASARLCTRRALLQNILFELNLPYREREEGELRLSLIDHLQPGPRCPNGMLLLVDEAHTLPLRLLEEIRMITNLVREGRTRVRLVLAGGPQLEERFAHPKLDSFNQRLAARCYLQPMTRQETADYVRFQIRAVGGQPERVFSPEALQAVFQATDGVPRLVNQICDHALLLACDEGRHQIDSEAVQSAWADLQRLPIPWQPESAATQASSGVIEFGQLSDETPLAPSEPAGAETRPLRIARPADMHSQPPAAATGGGTNPAPGADPLAGVFDEEEEIVDRYATLDAARCHTPPFTAAQPAVIRIGHEEQPAELDTRQPIDDSTFQIVEFAQPAYVSEIGDQEAMASAEPVEQCLLEDHLAVDDEGRREVVELAPAGIEQDDQEEFDAVRADDDRTMIVVADEPHAPTAVPAGRGRAERRDYRQLFARLRNQ
ncbi:MAG: AAA family ATPase [Pirellulaceae bacterium]|nr:AAA family ATPase [Pirellulaceae bacterium]